MFPINRLLEYCKDNKTAVALIKSKRKKLCIKLMVSAFAFFGIVVLPIFVQFDGIILNLIWYIAIIILFLYIVFDLLDRFLILSFKDIEIDYINCVLFEKATIEKYKVEGKDNSNVYILNQKDDIVKIPCFLEGTVEYIEIKTYFKIKDGLIDKVYKPICPDE